MSRQRRLRSKPTAPFDLGLESVSRLDALPRLLAIFRCGCSYWFEKARAGHWAWEKRRHCPPHVPR